MQIGVRKISNEELIRLAKNGDEEAKREIFIVNDRFCHYLAKKFRNTGIAYDDLLSIARLGMFKAYRSFDVDKGILFITYASRCMENEILVVLRREKKQSQVTNFSDIKFRNDKDGSIATIEEYVGEEDRQFDEIGTNDELKDIVKQFSEKATDLEKQILQYRIINDEMAQKELADKLGLSQSYISRIEKRVIRKMQKLALKNGLIEKIDEPKPKEVKKVKPKVNIQHFVYIMDNYPDFKQKDVAAIFGVVPSLMSAYFKSYNNGEYEAIEPSDDRDLGKRISNYIREHYPEWLAGPVKNTNKEIGKDEVKEIEKPVIKEETKPIKPSEYMLKILTGEKVVVTDEQLKTMLTNAMECLGMISNVTSKTEWTISA